MKFILKSNYLFRESTGNWSELFTLWRFKIRFYRKSRSWQCNMYYSIINHFYDE